MAENWKISQSAGLSIEHLPQPVSFTGWSGNLSYFDAGVLLALPLDLAQAQTSDSRIRFEYSFSEDSELTFHGRLENLGNAPLQIEKLTLKISTLETGETMGRLSVFKQGYQSWTETHSFSNTERELVSFLPPMTVLQANPRNLPSGERGEITSEMFSVIGDLDQNRFVLIGQGRPFDHFLYVNVKTTPLVSVGLVFDLGGKTIPPHGALFLDPFIILVDTHPNRILDRYLELFSTPAASRRELPVGWCSWYYYYTKVTQANLAENLAEIARRKVGWQYFVLDDGYQTAVGDWLSINSKFPDGLKAFAESCQSA
jgi:alpha-galactosidase